MVNKSTTVISSYSPKDTSSTADNLKFHLEHRSHKNDSPPIIDAKQTATYSSCFIVDTSTLTSPYVVGLDHSVTIM